MTDVIIAALGFGLLFIVLGVMQRTEPGCSGNCAACTHACDHDHQDEP